MRHQRQKLMVLMMIISESWQCLLRRQYLRLRRWTLVHRRVSLWQYLLSFRLCLGLALLSLWLRWRSLCRLWKVRLLVHHYYHYQCTGSLFQCWFHRRLVNPDLRDRRSMCRGFYQIILLEILRNSNILSWPQQLHHCVCAWLKICSLFCRCHL